MTTSNIPFNHTDSLEDGTTAAAAPAPAPPSVTQSGSAASSAFDAPRALDSLPQPLVVPKHPRPQTPALALAPPDRALSAPSNVDNIAGSTGSPPPDLSLIQVTMVDLDYIRRDNDSRVRTALDLAAIEDYARIFHAEKDDVKKASRRSHFPYPILFQEKDNEFWIGDGWHRISALQSIGVSWWPCEVRRGNKLDAIAFGVATDHGLGVRKTDRDKSRAVRMILRDSERAKWSNAEIARLCRVSDVLVGKIRKNMEESGDLPRMTLRRTRNGRTIETKEIGTKATSPTVTESVVAEDPGSATLATSSGSESVASGGRGTVAPSTPNHAALSDAVDSETLNPSTPMRSESVVPRSDATAALGGAEPFSRQALCSGRTDGGATRLSMAATTDTVILVKGERQEIPLKSATSVYVADVKDERVTLVFGE